MRRGLGGDSCMIPMIRELFARKSDRCYGWVNQRECCLDAMYSVRRVSS